MKYYQNYSSWNEDLFIQLLELNSIRKTSGISPNETKEFLDSIGNPEQDLLAVHVAGTNGKGSVVSYISSAFIADGRDVGTFISPHICDYRERFLINNRIQENDKILNTFKEMLEYKPKNLTKFELMTAFAFYFFKKEKVDVCVIETGMGGRLDATTVCNPFVTIITGIALDHTEYLGTTYVSIANEKLGIVKEKVPLYIYSQDADVRNLAESVCRQKKAKCNFVDYAAKIKKHSLEELQVEYSFKSGKKVVLETSMPGIYQITNMATAFAAIEEHLEYSSIASGFKEAFIPLRLQHETINGQTVVFDACHNPDGVAAFVRTLRALGLAEKKIGLIFNCKYNKDFLEMTNELFSLNIKKALFPKFRVGKNPEELVSFAKLHGIIDCAPAESISVALEQMTKDEKNRFDFILATGSIYMLGEVISSSLGKKYNDKEQD